MPGRPSSRNGGSSSDAVRTQVHAADAVSNQSTDVDPSSLVGTARPQPQSTSSSRELVGGASRQPNRRVRATTSTAATCRRRHGDLPFGRQVVLRSGTATRRVESGEPSRNEESPANAGLSGGADEGTRTLDLLHGTGSDCSAGIVTSFLRGRATVAAVGRMRSADRASPAPESASGDRSVPTSVDLELFAELVADRVAARMMGEAQQNQSAANVNERPLVLTARQVAARLGRSIDWVREHRTELGLIPSAGTRPRLLFAASTVEAWASTQEMPPWPPRPRDAPVRARPRRSRAPTAAADLLPIRGDRRAV